MLGGGSEGPAAHTLQKLTQLTPAPEYLAYEIKYFRPIWNMISFAELPITYCCTLQLKASIGEP